MAKPKALTPQEIYKQRKERDERERTAYLPPGLINHGNTCFMNSVLQGLIATRLLDDLVHFRPIPDEIQRTTATPILSRRSPQLTNGHNIAGPYEQPWVNTMPIGDMFLTLLYKAWDSQAMRRRDVLSPKPILGALGQKYDQYLDFAQQDAHEFLRILLDAMRMEEQDIIKKRQPPPSSHQKKRRRTTITPSNSQHHSVSGSSSSSKSADTRGSTHETSESKEEASADLNGDTHGPDESLLSFADMLFGGQLTSILVCQKCKNVSQTYEEFNDISLSIKAEDYLPHNRKRDRFKKIVGRLTAFQGNSSHSSSKDSRSKAALHPPVPPSHAIEMQRSSSVPPSPRIERTDNVLGGADDDHSRRRSFDVAAKAAESSSESSSPDMSAQSSTPAVAKESDSHVPVDVDVPELGRAERAQPDRGEVENEQLVIVNATEPDHKHVEFMEPKIDRPEQNEEKENEKANGKQKESQGGKDKEKAPKQDDSWAKIGRRISLSVGLGRPKVKDKEKDKKDRDRKSRSMDRGGGLSNQLKEIKEVAIEAADMGMKKSISALESLSKPSGDFNHEKRKVSGEGRPAISDSSSSSVASSSETHGQKTKPLPATPVPEPTVPPTTSHTPRHDNLSPHSIPASSSHLQPAPPAPLMFPNVQRSKSPKPPKPSDAEAEYLRKILADVSTAPSSHSPFAIFKPPLLHSHTAYHGVRAAFSSSTPAMSNPAAAPGGVGNEKTGGAAWLGMGMRNFSGIEECLRLFTAVEILDGENMVGCRRCWKIQNGVYHGPKEKHDDSDQEEEEEEDRTSKEPGVNGPEGSNDSGRPVEHKLPRPPILSTLSTIPASTPVHLPTSLSTPSVVLYSKDDRSDTRSISSLPTSPTSASQVSLDNSTESESSQSSSAATSEAPSVDNDMPDPKRAGPGGLPIPVISTTSPPETPTTMGASLNSLSQESSDPRETNREASYARLVGKGGNDLLGGTSSPAPHPRLTQALYGYNASSGSRDSLVIPQIGRPKYQKRKSYSDSTTTDNDSSGDESDTSIGTSVSADSTRSSQGPDAIPQVNGKEPTQNPVPGQNQVATTPAKKVVKPPKPVVMRPAYKRYLIAVPPPVLVIHLKRFQQTAKTPLVSFSHGFKKLEDYVSFPEYLDLLPFLAPRKEDYGLGKKSKRVKAKAKEEKCMYRLYAVVVHIGNMLGGHYIAYTALPDVPSTSTPDISSDPAGASSRTAAAVSDNTRTKESVKTDSSQSTRPAERQWAYISDTTVRLTTLEEVLHAKAYICMYERC